jgi:hypothetical protein
MALASQIRDLEAILDASAKYVASVPMGRLIQDVNSIVGPRDGSDEISFITDTLRCWMITQGPAGNERSAFYPGQETIDRIFGPPKSVSHLELAVGFPPAEPVSYELLAEMTEEETSLDTSSRCVCQ